MSNKPLKDNVNNALVQISDLSGNGNNPFTLTFDTDAIAAMNAALGTVSVKKLSFRGQITSSDRGDWTVSGTVGGTVTQSCVLTLEPVKTRIDADVTRMFVKEFEDHDEDSVTEMPDNVEIDPLGTQIDLGLIAQEVLALNLPDYPRADGATLENAQFAQPGIAPMTDDDAKPFAQLAALKDKLQK